MKNSNNQQNTYLQNTTNKAHEAKSKLKELTEFVIDVDQILKNQDYKALNQVISTHSNSKSININNNSNINNNQLLNSQKYPELNQNIQSQSNNNNKLNNQNTINQNNNQNIQKLEKQLNQSIETNQQISSLIKTIPGVYQDQQQYQISNPPMRTVNDNQNIIQKQKLIEIQSNHDQQIQQLQKELEQQSFTIQHLKQELEIEKEQKENLLNQDHWIKISTQFGTSLNKLQESYIRCELGVLYLQLNEDNNTQIQSILISQIKEVFYPKANIISIIIDENIKQVQSHYKTKNVYNTNNQYVGQDILGESQEQNIETLYFYFSNQKYFELFERYLYIECLCVFSNTSRELFNSPNLIRPFFNTYFHYAIPQPYLEKLKAELNQIKLPTNEQNYQQQFLYFQASNYQRPDSLPNPLDPTPKNEDSPIRKRQNVFVEDQVPPIQLSQQQQQVQSFQLIDLCQQSKHDSQSNNQMSGQYSIDELQKQQRITIIQKEQHVSSRSNINDQLKKAQQLLINGFKMTKYAPTQRHPNDKLIYLSEDSQKLYYVDPPPTGGVKPNTGKYMKVQEILRVDSASGNELGFQKFKNVRFGKETFGIVVTGERILELDSVRMEDKELFMSSLNILLQNKKQIFGK